MDTGRYHIIVVDDEPVARARLSAYFSKEGYRISEADSAAAMRRIVEHDPADLMMIDINLPGEDGLMLIRDVRARSNVPIILVTVRNDDVDRIVGLEIGADDYVTKPFNQRELLARVKNVLRRSTGQRYDESDVRRFHGWSFDMRQRRLADPAGAAVELTHAEALLIGLFLRHPGQTLSRERIVHEIAHRDWSSYDRTADVLVQRLRRKLGDAPRSGRFIQTAHGEGYVFVAPVR